MLLDAETKIHLQGLSRPLQACHWPLLLLSWQQAAAGIMYSSHTSL